MFSFQTFHTLCEIAELLIALQQVGNVQYIGWYITVPCKPEIMPELRKLHNTMNYELQNWREEVREARFHHYELNYFTTPQLLTLRKELGYLKSLNSRSVSISRQVQALLQSIAPVTDVQVLLDSLLMSDEHTSLTMQHQQIISGNEKEQESVLEEASECPGDLESLSPAQKCIFDYIMKMYGPRFKETVLKAFERGETEQDDIENLIMEPDEMAGTSEDDSSGDSSGEDDSSGDESDGGASSHQQRAKDSFKPQFTSYPKRNGMEFLSMPYKHTVITIITIFAYVGYTQEH